jgi:rhodanese-related sulfurtransferase
MMTDIREVAPAEAHTTLQQHPEAVYLDVRTEEEFEAGHPAGARNVPIVLLDPASGRPIANPDFLTVVGQHVARTAKLLVGCQAGGRSMRACEVLLQAGYTDVANVRGGFGGARDHGGRLVEPGWRDAGLPVETGATPGSCYADLAGRK